MNAHVLAVDFGAQHDRHVDSYDSDEPWLEGCEATIETIGIVPWGEIEGRVTIIGNMTIWSIDRVEIRWNGDWLEIARHPRGLLDRIIYDALTGSITDEIARSRLLGVEA